MSRVIHFEILADNPSNVAEFYKKALGWESITWGGEEPYWMVKTGPDNEEGINGALMGRYFNQAVINTSLVDDLDETLERVRKAGGKLVHGPNEVPSVGMHAYCSDPEGNLFGLMEPLSEEDGEEGDEDGRENPEEKSAQT